MADIGTTAFKMFSAGSHTWKAGMDENMLKASVLLQPSVKSRTTPLPATASDYECYIDPDTRKFCTWFDGEWQTITPKRGMWVHVEDTNSYATYDVNAQWITVIELGKSYNAIPRTLGVYVPGAIRPSGRVFEYVAAMEFVLPAGAPDSSATLEVAPTSEIVFGMTGGRIRFAAGATVGQFEIDSDVYVQPTQVEATLTRAQRLIITAPAKLHGAEGLAITLAGLMRGLS